MLIQCGVGDGAGAGEPEYTTTGKFAVLEHK